MASIKLPSQLSLRDGIGYSARRYYVDVFFASQSDVFIKAKKILDVGGTKDKKRGQFNISDYSSNVVILNIDDGKGADIVCDAEYIPTDDKIFDVVVCAEVLEHVKEPEKILAEIKRVLSDEGLVFLTAPFLFPVHADPHDFRRYTPSCWEHMLEKAGLVPVSIIQQGTFFSVLIDMVRMWVYRKISWKLMRYGLYFVLRPIIALSLSHDKKCNDTFQKSFSTGYGVIAKRR